MINASELERFTAIHESGHALMAAIQNLHITGMWMELYTEQSPLHGRVESGSADKLMREVLGWLSGPAAEVVFGKPESYLSETTDWLHILGKLTDIPPNRVDLEQTPDEVKEKAMEGLRLVVQKFNDPARKEAIANLAAALRDGNSFEAAVYGSHRLDPFIMPLTGLKFRYLLGDEIEQHIGHLRGRE